MLVITRSPGSSIMIGDDIRITVLRVQGSRIRLGITAPNNVHIRRDELPLKPEIRESRSKLAPQTNEREDRAGTPVAHEFAGRSAVLEFADARES